MSYYPIFVELEDQKILVVGGGKVSQRKIETFLKYGAEILIVSKELTSLLAKYVEEGVINQLDKEFDIDHLTDIFMVIAATDDPQLNAKISAEAKRRGILINAVDQPCDCTFIVPSIVKRGDLQVAVSTSGKSPAFAKKIRRELEATFGKGYKDFLVLMGVLRKEILKMGFPQEENSRIFHELVDSPVLEALEADDMNRLASILNRILNKNLSACDVEYYLKAG